jgi:hypothetical protein
MRLSSPDLVFFLNLSLEGVAVLLALLWHSATTKRSDKTAPLRAALLSIPLVGAALWSYAWYFAPLPPDLNGQSNKQGLILQTSDDSCSAAAAAMLLGFHGIAATEEEMARLSLTRDGQGTPPLGLFRGLHLKAREKQLQPQLRQLAGPTGFYRLGKPCIIGVGVRGDAPIDIQREMEVYGWQRGQRHTLIVLKADPQGKWIDVFDPSNGRERWPARDLQYLWNGQALILSPT